jgi:hypothetical protein
MEISRRNILSVSLRAKLILACQEGPNMSSALNEPHEIGWFLFKFKHHLQACIKSGKKTILRKTTNGKLNPVELKRIRLIYAYVQ